jgi:hypothetical protein
MSDRSKLGASGTDFASALVQANGSVRGTGDSATVQTCAPHADQVCLPCLATGLGKAEPCQIYHGDTPVIDRMISAGQTYTPTGSLGIPPRLSTLTFRSPDGTISPTELGLGNDSRKLSFAILDPSLLPAK